MRDLLLVFGQRIITLEASIGASRSIFRPGSFPFFLMCLVWRLTFSMVTLLPERSVLTIFPVLPLFFPAMTMMESPSLSFITLIIMIIVIMLSLYDLWCQRDYFLIAFVSKFTGDRSEDSCSPWVSVAIDNDNSIIIEAD